MASDFFRYPRFGDPDLEAKPKSTVLLFGMVCADFSGQELLLPNTTSLSSSGVHPHRARLWLAGEEVQSGSAVADGAAVAGGRTFSFWNIDRNAVTIEAIDGNGRSLTSQSPALDWRNSPAHPWTDRKWVRCLGQLTNRSMIPAASRRNTSLVSSRLDMHQGTITPMPPFTEQGRNTEWKVAAADGTELVGATTDAMIWQREYAPSVAAFRVTLQPLDVTVPQVARTVVVSAVQQSLIAAVTHVMQDRMATNVLTDTRAFAQLLVGGNVATHPTAIAHRNQPPSLAATSGDVHCECSCN